MGDSSLSNKFFEDTQYLLGVDFVQSSLWACALLGILSGVMTSLIVLRQMSFSVHATSELALMGASAALLFGFNRLWCHRGRHRSRHHPRGVGVERPARQRDWRGDELWPWSIGAVFASLSGQFQYGDDAADRPDRGCFRGLGVAAGADYRHHRGRRVALLAPAAFASADPVMAQAVAYQCALSP